MEKNRDIFVTSTRLRMYGISANRETIEKNADFIKCLDTILTWEEIERTRRKRELFAKKSGVKNLSLMASFDWNWPEKIDREQILELFSLHFIKENQNIVLIGNNGVGKSMIAKNLVKTAADSGQPALFVECSKLLDEMLESQKIIGLEKALAKYLKPKLLAIDELGYMSLSQEHADLLFQLIHRRTEEKSTIITTNIVFQDWPTMFPNTSTVTAIVDRLIERCEVIQIIGNSYRQKRHKEQTEANQARRALGKNTPKQKV
jgi:DNA replication protein DnaC